LTQRISLMNSPAYFLASLLLLTTSCRFQSGFLAEQETEITFPASDPSVVQHIEGLDYQSDDEAGMSHQSLKVVRLIATSNFFRNLPKSAPSVTPLLGFESGPEMGTDDPSPVYRFRFYRDPSIQGAWWETLVYDPERAVLYLEYPEDGILEPLEVDQRMLADVRMTMAR
jgi:hypothetical protein